MGIIEEKLGATTLSDGREVDIEYNSGGHIHVHVDDFRLTLSAEEFREIAGAVSDGKTELEETKQIGESKSDD